jgi:hypothetical protein
MIWLQPATLNTNTGTSILEMVIEKKKKHAKRNQQNFFFSKYDTPLGNKVTTESFLLRSGAKLFDEKNGGSKIS